MPRTIANQRKNCTYIQQKAGKSESSIFTNPSRKNKAVEIEIKEKCVLIEKFLEGA
jgi:hypothetical protein